MEAHLSPRGRCIALIPYYAGARISEVVRLDVGDVQMSARKGKLRLYGKGGKFREVDICPKLRTELQLWLDERPDWPHADISRALFLNAKGGRLSVRAAGGIIAEIAQTAGLDDPTTANRRLAWGNARQDRLMAGLVDISAGPDGDPVTIAKCMRENGVPSFPAPGTDGAVVSRRAARA
ncbi:site-specific integrase [Nonomuraea lactucae]|uniref:site-specific integrase n=1 Tax=Nonomuraea lactucae TaxID=2249762 RepID=UPI0013B415C7|nr:tyrosine-type recombinase/integrase [Nonomuraea lactucae]